MQNSEEPGSSVAELDPPPETSDQALLRRLRDGDPAAAEVVYRRYAPRLRALVDAKRHASMARRLDTDDVLQSAFRSFFRGAQGGRYEVPDGEELWKLVLAITLNKLRAAGAYHRAAKRDVRRTVGDEQIEQGAAASRTEQEPRFLLRLAIEEAMDRLPADQRQAVHLRIRGHSVGEIAERTGRSRRTIERTLQEARDCLSKLIGELE